MVIKMTHEKEPLLHTDDSADSGGTGAERKKAEAAQEDRIKEVFDVLAAEISRVVALIGSADLNSLPGLIGQYKSLIGQVDQIAATSPRIATTRIALKRGAFNSAKTNSMGGSVAIPEEESVGLRKGQGEAFEKIKAIVSEGTDTEFGIIVGLLEAIVETVERVAEVAKEKPELQLSNEDIQKDLQQAMLDAFKSATEESEGFSKWMAAQKDKSMGQGGVSLGKMVGDLINQTLKVAKDVREGVEEFSKLGLGKVASALDKDLLGELREEKERVEQGVSRDIGKEDLQAGSAREQKPFFGIDIKGIFADRIGANTFKLEAEPKVDTQGKEVGKAELGKLKSDAPENTVQREVEVGVGREL